MVCAPEFIRIMEGLASVVLCLSDITRVRTRPTRRVVMFKDTYA